MADQVHLHVAVPELDEALGEPLELQRARIDVTVPILPAPARTAIDGLVRVVKVEGIEADDAQLVGNHVLGKVAASQEGIALVRRDVLLPDIGKSLDLLRRATRHGVVQLNIVVAKVRH